MAWKAKRGDVERTYLTGDSIGSRNAGDDAVRGDEGEEASRSDEEGGEVHGDEEGVYRGWRGQREVRMMKRSGGEGWRRDWGSASLIPETPSQSQPPRDRSNSQRALEVYPRVPRRDRVAETTSVRQETRRAGGTSVGGGEGTGGGET